MQLCCCLLKTAEQKQKERYKMEYKDAIIHKWINIYENSPPRYYPAMLLGRIARMSPSRQVDEHIYSLAAKAKEDAGVESKMGMASYVSNFSFDVWASTKDYKKKLMVLDNNMSILWYLYSDPRFLSRIDDSELRKAANWLSYKENPPRYYWDWVREVASIWMPSDTKFRLSSDLRSLVRVWENLSSRCR